MPLYEYHCETCETDFELLRKFSEADDEAVCPECCDAHTERKVSAAACGTGTGSIGPSACSAFT